MIDIGICVKFERVQSYWNVKGRLIDSYPFEYLVSPNFSIQSSSGSTIPYYKKE